MLSLAHAQDQVRDRGPFYAVLGTIRRDEMRLHLVATASDAERLAEKMRDDHLRQVRVYQPDGEPDLARVGRELFDARIKVAEATALARAAAFRSIEAGMSEVETARQLGVDRMTVRSWLGKR